MVGMAWIVLAVVLFLIHEMQNAEEKLRPLSETTQKEAELQRADGRALDPEAPTDWTPKVRDFSRLPPESWREYVDQRNVVARFEAEARTLLDRLRKSNEPSPPPPSAIERRRFQTQLDELQLAREFFADSDDDPQQVGRVLTECDARMRTLRLALGLIPAEANTERPLLAGRAMFDEAIARRPKNPALYVERAKHNIGQRQFRAAIADCNYALTLLPYYYAAFSIRGFAYHHLGRFSAAARDFERAIYENPSYAWAYASLAATYNATAAYREALGPAYYASRDIPAGHNQLAIAYEHLAEHERAVHHLTKVIEADPNAERVPNARVRRARQLQKLGHTELAIYDLKTQLSRRADSETTKLLADLERLAARHREARSLPNGDGEQDDQHDQLALSDSDESVGR
jgi:tetratricopeptide (TPR) repeat protein